MAAEEAGGQANRGRAGRDRPAVVPHRSRGATFTGGGNGRALPDLFLQFNRAFS
jgi:hypothetical protein